MLDEYGGHVRFSGSVTPMPLLQRLHGTPDGSAARAVGAFGDDQLEVLVVPDISTYYRQRKVSLPALAEFAFHMLERTPGCHFIAFPSFEYLDLFAGYLADHPTPFATRFQSRGMDDTARAEFLRAIDTESGDGLVGIVLGGSFSESVELQHRRLAGLMVVGIGYPPRTDESTAVQNHFDRLGEDGHCVAFEQPAMVKVVQAAGRILRSPEDRGVLCLIDPRFLEPRYQRFFPRFWRPVKASARQIAQRVVVKNSDIGAG